MITRPSLLRMESSMKSSELKDMDIEKFITLMKLKKIRIYSELELTAYFSMMNGTLETHKILEL